MTKDSYMTQDEFGSAAQSNSRGLPFNNNFSTKPINVGNLDRFAGLVIGVAGLFLISRRLLIYVGLAFASAYLIYRGATGYCFLYDRANINTNQRSKSLEDQLGSLATSANTPVATSTPPVEYNDDPIDGRVEQASWESFPASDPPGF